MTIHTARQKMIDEACSGRRKIMAALSAVKVERLRLDGNINDGFCNACKWLNKIIQIVIMSVKVLLLGCLLSLRRG